MSEECSFSFVTFFNENIVIPPTDVHNCELGASTKAINDLRDEGGYILVPFYPICSGVGSLVLVAVFCPFSSQRRSWLHKGIWIHKLSLF